MKTEDDYAAGSGPPQAVACPWCLVRRVECHHPKLATPPPAAPLWLIELLSAASFACGYTTTTSPALHERLRQAIARATEAIGRPLPDSRPPETPATLGEFTCSDCGGTFNLGRPDEDAHAETIENFGVRGDAPGIAIVCDDCYREIMGRIKS